MQDYDEKEQKLREKQDKTVQNKKYQKLRKTNFYRNVAGSFLGNCCRINCNLKSSPTAKLQLILVN